MKEKEVINFLKDHPNFFHKHLDLLKELNVPHPFDSNKVVSLLERQVHLLRTSTAEYKQQFQCLIQIARDNETIVQRSKKIVLAGTDCANLDDFAIMFDDVMRNDFDIKHYSILLFSDNPLDTNIPVYSLSKTMSALGLLLANADRYHAKLSNAEIQYLFPDGVSVAKAFAVFPLLYRYQGSEHYLGVFALASDDEYHFSRNKKRLSLDYFSELLSSILIRLML